jgi:Protein of unknown function (DUF2865)
MSALLSKADIHEACYAPITCQRSGKETTKPPSRKLPELATISENALLETQPLRSTIHQAWRTTILVVGLVATLGAAVPNLAHADGPFDFFFNLFQPRSAPQQQSARPAPPVSDLGRIAPAPLGGQESVTDSGGSTGHSVAFCVRLCDGQHFPIEQLANGTPGETCRATCPYSKTKVFFGSEVGAAVAQDGQHYSALDTAFLYRKQLVTNCTCNGKSALGLASFDVKRDPTLRPGDIVSTKEGLLAYTGRSQESASFTPVNPAALPVNIRPTSPQSQPALTGEQMTDDPGTIVQLQGSQTANPPSGR